METFVVRVYRPDGGSGELRGLVDDVATGVRARFLDGSELLWILGRGVTSTDGKPERPEASVTDGEAT
jgi:hypothetical protein